MTDGVRCMIMRGGSSKGAYFVREDLPAVPTARDPLLRRIMGTPDPRQIDGIGGAHPLTSKVAIVAASDADDVDLEYLFLQVGVEDDVVTDAQNCGNLLAGVGPFAVERGLVNAPADGEATVRIRMLNTQSLAVARFPMAAGRPVYGGSTTISGVPGAGAAIELEFADVAGSSTGSLLPTGRTTDIIDAVPCTLIDHGMPVVVVAAESLGVTGYETCAQLETNEQLRPRVEALRLQAGELMGLGDVTRMTVPKVSLVAAPRDGGHLCTRTFIPHRCHDAIGVLGAVSVATTVLLDGTPARRVSTSPDPGAIRLEHPTGFFDAMVHLTAGPDGVRVERAGIVRTARKLMDGVVFPRPD